MYGVQLETISATGDDNSIGERLLRRQQEREGDIIGIAYKSITADVGRFLEEPQIDIMAYSGDEEHQPTQSGTRQTELVAGYTSSF